MPRKKYPWQNKHGEMGHQYGTTHFMRKKDLADIAIHLLETHEPSDRNIDADEAIATLPRTKRAFEDEVRSTLWAYGSHGLELILEHNLPQTWYPAIGRYIERLFPELKATNERLTRK